MSKKSIREIEEELKACTENRTLLYQVYQTDDRSGVQKLIAKYRKMDQKREEELERTAQMSVYENQYYARGLVCGIDEVGRLSLIHI